MTVKQQLHCLLAFMTLKLKVGLSSTLSEHYLICMACNKWVEWQATYLLVSISIAFDERKKENSQVG